MTCLLSLSETIPELVTCFQVIIMSSTENLLPYFGSEKRRITGFLTVPFVRFAWIVLSLPFFGLVFCVVWSIIYNFEDANSTHCSVENYLPSISAAIGNFYPQKYVWMLAISFDFFPRLSVLKLYSKYFRAVIDARYSRLYFLTIFLHFFENCFLLGLTLIASTSHYTLHAFCFVSFLITSMFYMGLTCYLLKFRRKIPPSNLEARTLKWKFQFFLINIICFLFAGYFFYRHNKYCEPGVYSIFALCEYGVVLSNMCFHVLAVWDFYDKTMTVSLSGIEPHSAEGENNFRNIQTEYK